eukprot:CAMPEP_0196581566 /NCGR_PEP_ID=MMETSP1081-20130531/34256_1 /TAXON_ID=36882 /ORGANISM="Pyramimonas amylifera, Strain CCMP720" /LENGTH=300 /DNA_ID=CAMNT_0041901833 /DNA_START=66 /DNA_END=968 /DNA_ORIENTATION=+
MCRAKGPEEGILKRQLTPEEELLPSQDLLGGELWEEELLEADRLVMRRAQQKQRGSQTVMVEEAARVQVARGNEAGQSDVGQRIFLSAIAMIGTAFLLVSWRSSGGVTRSIGGEGSEGVPLMTTYTLSTNQNPDQVMGHRRMDEAPLKALKPVVPGSRILLRPSAAESFVQMQAAAARDGVQLVPISGFRSIEDQNSLFFQVKSQRSQSAAERARVSAPPGFSEHHTGYALDIGTRGHYDLEEDFEKTPAFRWLQQNGNRFHWEMSFPKNNPGGVAYEPWHYRFTGDSLSLSIFARGIEP